MSSSTAIVALHLDSVILSNEARHTRQCAISAAPEMPTITSRAQMTGRSEVS